MNNEYINKGFRILHLTKQPQAIIDIYNSFMVKYNIKHTSKFNWSGQIPIYYQAQAETFYRYTRRYYMPLKGIESKL